jgi:hypothetical protein
MDPGKRPRRRLRSLLPRESGPRRRSLAREDPLPEPEPDGDIVRAIWGDDYPSDAIQRSYAAWGCSPPPPPERKD